MFIFYAMKPVIDTREKQNKNTLSEAYLHIHVFARIYSNIFIYVGTEVIAGDSSVAYAQTSNLQPLKLYVSQLVHKFKHSALFHIICNDWDDNRELFE